MKTVGIVLGVLLAIGVALGGSIFLAYQSMYDTAVGFENNIKKLDKQSEASLSSTTIKIQNAVGLAAQYTDSLKEVVRAAVEGRYGKDGSKATMQWIQEQNPVYDSKVTLKVQDIIDGGGSEFKITQDRKIEECTKYETSRDSLVRGFFLKAAGFPKKDVEDMCKVISDASTRDAFSTGLQKPVIQAPSK